jgi:lysozyme
MRVNLDRYSPYAVSIIGPLPGLVSANPVEAPAVAAEAPASPEPVATESESSPDMTSAHMVAAETASPVTPLASAAPTASPFGHTDQRLVLTPATEDDFIEAERPVWPTDQRAEAPEAGETVLFEDEPTLSVLRHEVEPAGPRKFDWADTGMYMFIGGLGLASCAFSAAAFRLAVEEPSPMGETVVLGWALALIGVICVGVSSWNLYVRWGKPD